MAARSQKEIDKLLAHTIRIELKDGFILYYYVSAEAKNAFHKRLNEETNIPYGFDFIWFYIPEDRLVLVNNNEIIRITFLFDPPDGDKESYFDNFKVLPNSPDLPDINEDLPATENLDEPVEDGLYLPKLIIMHRRHLEDTEIVDGVTMKTQGYFGNISSYYSLHKGALVGIEIEYAEVDDNWELLTNNYLQFIDDDGEENYMPLRNLSVIEIERPLLMTDELLDRYLGRKTKKPRKK